MMAPVAEVEGERERLLNFSFPELKIIAKEMGAATARSKVQLAENILARRAGAPPEVVEEVDDPAEPETAGAAPGESAELSAGVEAGTEVESETEEVEVIILPVKHLMLTMFESADPNTGVLDQVGVNERVDEFLALGYEPIEFTTLGFSPGGHRLFYVFELVDKPRYTRSMHIMRLLTPQPNPVRGSITGFQADAYISAFVEQGWRLIGARYNGDDVLGETMTGIYIIWMLVK